MAVVPKFKVIEGWEQLPQGYVHKDVDGVATDSKDNVYLMTRMDARVIVYDRNGAVARASCSPGAPVRGGRWQRESRLIRG